MDDDVAAWHGHAVGDGMRDDVGVGEAADGERFGRVAGVVAVDIEEGGDEWIVGWDVVDVFHACWFTNDGAVALAHVVDDGIIGGAAWVAQVDEDAGIFAVAANDARINTHIAHDAVVVGDAEAFAIEVFVQVLAEKTQKGVGVAKVIVGEEGGEGGGGVETNLWFHGMGGSTVAGEGELVAADVGAAIGGIIAKVGFPGGCKRCAAVAGQGAGGMFWYDVGANAGIKVGELTVATASSELEGNRQFEDAFFAVDEREVGIW